MDFTEIICQTRKYNLHSHTQYCDGRADMATMARAAVSCGIIHYGFTPHSPVPIASPCNMSFDNIENYFAEVERIKNDPQFSSCHFYAGMEIDYLGDDWNASIDFFKLLPLDYSIGSVHFIPTQDGDYIDIDGKPEQFRERMIRCFRNDIEYVVDTFYRQTERMILTGGFDLLGHFDKIAHNASTFKPGILKSTFYKQSYRRALNLILEKNIAVEVNTKARKDYGFIFPSEIILDELLRNRVALVVNSDAHYPEKVNASREEVFQIIDRLSHCEKN